MADILDKLNDVEDAQERTESSLKLTWAWIGCAIAYIIITALFPLHEVASGSQRPSWLMWVKSDAAAGVIVEARSALAGALATFCFLGIIFEVYLKSNPTSKIEAGLTRIVFGNRKILDSFSVLTKELFVRNSLRSTLGNDTGDAVFTGVVHPLMADGRRYRKNYNYDIVLLDQQDYPTKEDLGAFSEAFSVSSYRWVEEEIGYESFNPHDGSTSYGPFTVLLLFDKQTLPEVFKDNSVYFRSLVELEAESVESVFDRTDDEIREFVKTAMNFSAKQHSGHKSVRYEITVDRSGAIDSSGAKQPVVRIDIGMIDEVPKNKLIVKQRYPHYREVTEVTITLPQPSEGARFSVQASSDVHRLEPIYYVTSSSEDPIQETRPGRAINVELGGWLFPTSGVTFTWNNILDTNIK